MDDILALFNVRPVRRWFAFLSQLTAFLAELLKLVCAGFLPVIDHFVDDFSDCFVLQPFGDALRFNPHFHALILEGSFDPNGQFYFLPIHDTARLTQLLRQRTIGLFLKLGLITEQFSKTLLCWRHSGFSVMARHAVHPGTVPSFSPPWPEVRTSCTGSGKRA